VNYEIISIHWFFCRGRLFVVWSVYSSRSSSNRRRKERERERERRREREGKNVQRKALSSP
jgi:hypothetical protein